MRKFLYWCANIEKIWIIILLFGSIREIAARMSVKIASSISLGRHVGFGGQYKLLDFGHGQRLEQFGKYIVRRPCPVAVNEKPTLSVEQWNLADIYYVGKERNSSWLYKDCVIRENNQVADWKMSSGNNLRFILDTYDSGQIGVFPEQLDIWNWLENYLGDYFVENSSSEENFSVLNGFGYTGGSTMACLVSPLVQVFRFFYLSRNLHLHPIYCFACVLR